MHINLTGRTALVTGATGQLGRVMARTLASCGADVIIHYLNNEAKALEIKAEIEAIGRKSMIVKAEISDSASMMAMKEEIYAQFERVDIVVANAVSQYTWTSILEQAPEDYLDQFNSCVIQSVLLAKAFVPQMIEHKYGRIIGINTECSLQTFPGQSAYVAAKRGMDGLYRVLSKEVGEHQITVNQVAPGWMISEKYRETETESQTEYEKMVPLKRRGEDQDIANTVAFLASDLANFITGGFIPVSGGSVAVGI